MKSKMKLQTSKNPDHELGGDFYAGGQSETAKEAKNKAEGFKRGGKAKHHAMHEEHEMHKKHGGKAKKHVGHVDGEHESIMLAASPASPVAVCSRLRSLVRPVRSLLTIEIDCLGQ